jgi:DNA-binding beta-propeller fold protein YncE
VETITISESSPMVADQNGLWVADALTGEVHRLDPETGAMMATIPTGLPIIPNSVRFPMLEGAGRSFASIGGIGTDGASVWVGDQGGAVLRIDPATDTVVQRFEVPARPDYVRSDGQHVLVASPRRGEVAVLSASGALVLTETYPEAIAGAELFGGAVYVQNASDGTVTRIELATGTETRSEPLGPSVVRNQEPTLPTGLVVTEDGLLADTADEPNSLHVLDPVTLVEIETLEIPADQGDMAIGPDGSAWIVRTRENTIVRIIPTSASS